MKALFIVSATKSATNSSASKSFQQSCSLYLSTGRSSKKDKSFEPVFQGANGGVKTNNCNSLRIRSFQLWYWLVLVPVLWTFFFRITTESRSRGWSQGELNPIKFALAEIQLFFVCFFGWGVVLFFVMKHYHGFYRR